MSRHAIETGFNLQEGCGNPTLTLVAVLPSVHAVGVDTQALVYILDAVSGLYIIQPPHIDERHRLSMSVVAAQVVGKNLQNALAITAPYRECQPDQFAGC